MTLREKVALARHAARWKNEDENAAAIAEVLRWAEDVAKTVTHGSHPCDHPPAISPVDFVRNYLKREAGEG